MALHHTEEEQKRFWELMNRFENEEEAIKNGFFEGFTEEEVIFMGEMDIVKFGNKCLIREKVVTFRMVKLNLLLSIFLITK